MAAVEAHQRMGQTIGARRDHVQQRPTLGAELALIDRMRLVALQRQLPAGVAGDLDAATDAAVAADGLDGCRM